MGSRESHDDSGPDSFALIFSLMIFDLGFSSRSIFINCYPSVTAASTIPRMQELRKERARNLDLIHFFKHCIGYVLRFVFDLNFQPAVELFGMNSTGLETGWAVFEGVSK